MRKIVNTSTLKIIFDYEGKDKIIYIQKPLSMLREAITIDEKEKEKLVKILNEN